MSVINRYVTIDRDGNESDEYDTYREALAAAESATGLAIIERNYEYSDSSLVWTPDGGDTWPIPGDGGDGDDQSQ